MLKMLLSACGALLVSAAACAGTISFQLSLTGANLTVTSQGDSSAFYPAVFRLLADGRWERLALVAGAQAPAELVPGAHLDLRWPDLRPLESVSPIERLRPTMIRFFDQAGVSFGQLSFMQTPPAAPEKLQVSYGNGELTIMPPKDANILATWILWPQEEGIEPIRRPVLFDHIQPAAQRVAWHTDAKPLRLFTGAALPAATLVHETASGLMLQQAGRGVVQGRQQRSGWLDNQLAFYVAALLVLASAIGFPLLQAWRNGAKR